MSGVAIVRYIPRAFRVKHLVDFHGSPLAPRIQRHTLDTSPILLPLLLREKEIPIDLLCTKGPRDVTSYRDPRNPKACRKNLKEIADACGFKTPLAMRRTFLRVLGITAGEYASRFKRSQSQTEMHR
jgi:AraC-like DNA-binding protein